MVEVVAGKWLWHGRLYEPSVFEAKQGDAPIIALDYEKHNVH